MYSVFPTISRVRNRGLDGSGENCSCVAENIYNDQVIYSGEDIYEIPFDIKPDNEINRILYQHFKKPLKSKLKILFELLLLNNGLLHTNNSINS